MNLNDPTIYQKLDREDMIGHINGLPDQLAAAWKLGTGTKLPAWKDIGQVVATGMGGSAIGADLLAAYAASKLTVPFLVHRGYGLPSFVGGEETLVICSSHSGNTEETLSAFEAAKARGCRILAVSTGGKLAAAAEEAGQPVWRFEHKGQPRTAVGFSFGLLLAAAHRLGLIPDPASEVADAVSVMKAQQADFLPEVPDTGNPAKRMAGQMMERWITIWGAGLMAPVARRWKTQINENAKAQATLEVLPEADHNAIQGTEQPQSHFGATMNIFLRAAANHPRDELRTDHTRMAVMLQGQNTDSITGLGDSPLAQQWTALHHGDYVSYYLAIAYGLDPTPVPALVELKEKLNKN